MKDMNIWMAKDLGNLLTTYAGRHEIKVQVIPGL